MTTSNETYENIRKIIWDNDDGRDSSGPVFRRHDNSDNEDLEGYESEDGKELFEEEEYMEEMDPQHLQNEEEEGEIFTEPINMVTRGDLAQADKKWRKAAKLKRVRFETEMSPDFQEHTSSQRYAMGQEEYEEASDPIRYLKTPNRWANVKTDQQRTLTQLQRPKNFKKLDKMARTLSTLRSVPGDQEVLREQYKKHFMEEQRLLSITTDVATKEEWAMAKGIFKRRKKLAELSFPGKLDGQLFNFPVIMIDDFSSQNKNIPVIRIDDSESTGRRETTKLVSIAPRHREIQEVPDDDDDLDVIDLSDSNEDEIDEGPRDGDEEIMVLDEQIFIEERIPDEQEYQEPTLNSWQQYKRNPVRKCRSHRFEDPVYVYEEPPVVTRKRKRVWFQETHSGTLEQQLRTKHADLTPQKKIVPPPPPPPKIIEAQLFIPERLRVEEGLRRQKEQRRRLQEDQLLSIPYDEATPEQIYKAGLIQMERQKERMQGNAFQDVYVVARKACWQSL
ncbi:hypothetical protein CAEBREN_01875 [Caenorhabditis brenneri]|uniref:Uncharacterized protein n=1 Tax=Caenorhabditis brenneri TaxID=135651 RepID=G0P714_CAEBE|nr:hypothetical protein CAEBREN_01875 [Caenorhabditis brenneri]